MRSCWCERTAQWLLYGEGMPVETLSVNKNVCTLLISARVHTMFKLLSLHEAGHVVMALVYILALWCYWLVKSGL